MCSAEWHECSEICVLYEGPGRPTAWPEQSQVVVETVTKTSTTQKFAAVQQVHESDATKVTATGAGLQYATANKEATFTVDTSHGGMYWAALTLHGLAAYLRNCLQQCSSLQSRRKQRWRLLILILRKITK